MGKPAKAVGNTISKAVANPVKLIADISTFGTTAALRALPKAIGGGQSGVISKATEVYGSTEIGVVTGLATGGAPGAVAGGLAGLTNGIVGVTHDASGNSLAITSAIAGGASGAVTRVASLAASSLAPTPAATSASEASSLYSASSSSLNNVAGVGPLDLNYAGGGSFISPGASSGVFDAGVLGATLPGSPASMGSTSLLSSIARTGGNFVSSIFGGIADAGKAIISAFGANYLYQKLNQGNSQPQGYSYDNGGTAPPNGGDGGGITINDGIPGSIGGNGSGYGPYGSTAPTPGTPSAEDMAPTLFRSGGGTSSGILFYGIMFGLVFAGYWFLFRKRKLALA